MWNGEFLLWLSGLGTQHSTHEDAGSIPSLTQRVRDRCYCKLQHRLQMWLRSSVTVVVVYTSATAPIWPLVQKLPYATGVAIKGKINVWNISKENIIFLSLKLLFSRLQKTTSVFWTTLAESYPWERTWNSHLYSLVPEAWFVYVAGSILEHPFLSLHIYKTERLKTVFFNSPFPHFLPTKTILSKTRFFKVEAFLLPEKLCVNFQGLLKEKSSPSWWVAEHH